MRTSGDPLYRASMLKGMASIMRILLDGCRHTTDPLTRGSCLQQCEAMEKMAGEEHEAGASHYGELIEAGHAAYTSVLPPNIMLTEDEKVRAFDRLRAKLYPNGHDPFGSPRRWP